MPKKPSKNRKYKLAERKAVKSSEGNKVLLDLIKALESKNEVLEQRMAALIDQANKNSLGLNQHLMNLYGNLRAVVESIEKIDRNILAFAEMLKESQVEFTFSDKVFREIFPSYEQFRDRIDLKELLKEGLENYQNLVDRCFKKVDEIAAKAVADREATEKAAKEAALQKQEEQVAQQVLEDAEKRDIAPQVETQVQPSVIPEGAEIFGGT